ncbi:MAG: hypothetical protein EOP04_14020 [Proteobacteria bacterium]|nr:MAG: hypothetical protein EOP04_14020 [Pseudomonadota bacterium]
MANESIYRAAAITAGATIIGALIMRNWGCAPFSPVPATPTPVPIVILTAAPVTTSTSAPTPTPIAELYSGMVLNDNDDGIDNAEVVITERNVPTTVYTETDGHFSYSLKGAPFVRIYIRKEGYKSRKWDVDPKDDKALRVFHLKKLPITRASPTPKPTSGPIWNNANIAGTFDTPDGVHRLVFSRNGTYQQYMGGIPDFSGKFFINGDRITVTGNIMPTITIHNRDDLTFGAFEYARTK